MLNKALHGALKKRFGRVTVSAPGQRVVFRRRDGWAVDPKGGERYITDCPFCGGRDKLWTSYAALCTLVTSTGTLKFPGYITYCYKCEFPKSDGRVDSKKLKAFWKSLGYSGIDITHLRNVETADDPAPREERTPDMPESVPVAEASPRAREYLASRGFHDLDELWRIWRVCYSEDTRYFNSPRIVYPIYQHGGFVGWQARYIGEDYELRDEQKYLFPQPFTKSLFLYNLDVARLHRTVVICEGVTDAQKVGPQAVACFGKKLSRHQMNLITSHWCMGSAVILLDEDAGREAEKLHAVWTALGAFKEGVRNVRLGAKDAGAMTRDEIWKAIGL